ncbi:MAG: hypothetical protein B7Z75_12015 [Acidocella sp. 20-57-95]|nr:MAG: hypothetical protein B7Z75_12015 [Acidocella sp. 20-57-95]
MAGSPRAAEGKIAALSCTTQNYLHFETKRFAGQRKIERCGDIPGVIHPSAQLGICLIGLVGWSNHAAMTKLRIIMMWRRTARVRDL